MHQVLLLFSHKIYHYYLRQEDYVLTGIRLFFCHGCRHDGYVGLKEPLKFWVYVLGIPDFITIKPFDIVWPFLEPQTF